MANFSGLRAVVIGGDNREHMLAEILRGEGAEVQLWGREPGEPPLHTLVQGAWAILPVSGVAPGGEVRAPHGSLQIDPECLAQSLGVVVGLADGDWVQQCPVQVIEYRERDVFAWQNAVPTAEGAIQWALSCRPDTLFGRMVGITGFGRVAEVLAHRVKAMGATTLVLARSADDRAHARAVGLAADALTPEALADVQILFNTVPAPIFDESLVRSLPGDTAVLDMASAPGGFTEGARDTLGSRRVWLPSLPGMIAPRSAALIIANTLREVLD